MPLSAEHKRATRKRIVEHARRLFNRHGFHEVSIDEIMAAAGLTRGGFYNHFNTKDELYAEAITHFAEMHEANGSEPRPCGRDLARMIVNGYVSRDHLDDVEGHCPLIALSSDVSRAGITVRRAYRQVFEGLVAMISAGSAAKNEDEARRFGLAAAASCVGAMTLSRTIDDAQLADEICVAVREMLLAELSGEVG